MRETLNNEIFSLVALKNDSSFLKFHDLVEGYVYFKNFRFNLKTQTKERYPIKNYFNLLNKINFKKNFNFPRIIHLFYEIGHIINKDVSIPEDNILAIDLKYLRYSPYKLKKTNQKFKIQKKKSISYSYYEKKILEVKKHLIEGNSYQLNLTFPIEFSFTKKVPFEKLIGRIWENPKNRGAYAHASFIPTLNKILISNSPECLFQIKKKESSLILWSMPIKGSLNLKETGNLKKAWEKLKKCRKNQAELFMISDLIRNDLSKIEKANAKIVFKRMPLRVPKILHQYSLLAVELSKNVTLLNIIRSLFPGGSVTGAPKRRSMEILYEIESKYPRGFYCGSTIILHKSLLAASINIRSATIDTSNEKFLYGSGGGITLQSIPKMEFEEMNLKFESFLKSI